MPFSFIFIFFFCASALATIGPDDCPDRDYSKRFGPIRDQGSHGYCWAFSAAGLMEEEYCLEDSNLCGKSISPLDISYCDFKFTKAREGGSPYEALKCALENGGVCTENYAPYARSQQSLWCWFVGKATGETSCADRALVDIYNDYKKGKYFTKPLSSTQFCPAFEKEAAAQNLKWAVADIRTRIPENIENGADIETALKTSSNSIQFLKSILITPACIQNRIKPNENLIPKHKSFTVKESVEEKIQQVKNILLSGRSMALEDCISYGPRKPTDPCPIGHHAAIIDGMRWDPIKNMCMLQIKNSWGKTSYSAWYGAEGTLNGATGLSYLEKKAN